MHQESVSRFFAFSCVLKIYEMQKLETQFFFSSTSKNNNYVFSIYTRYQGLLLHIFSDLPAFSTILAFPLKEANLRFGQK